MKISRATEQEPKDSNMDKSDIYNASEKRIRSIAETKVTCFFNENASSTKRKKFNINLKIPCS